MSTRDKIDKYDALSIMTEAISMGGIAFEQFDELLYAEGNPEEIEHGLFANENAPFFLTIMQSLNRHGVDLELEIANLKLFIRSQEGGGPR